jgi:hypothetical protein
VIERQARQRTVSNPIWLGTDTCKDREVDMPNKRTSVKKAAGRKGGEATARKRS